MIIQEKVPAVAAAETVKIQNIIITLISNNSPYYKLVRRKQSPNIVTIFNAFQPSRVNMEAQL